MTISLPAYNWHQVLNEPFKRGQKKQALLAIKTQADDNDIEIKWMSAWKFLLKGEAMAFIEDQLVHIPKPECPYTLMICFHELGHILNHPINDHDYDSWYAPSSTEKEYYAEQYALEQGRHFGLSEAFLQAYECRAKEYVFSYVNDDHLGDYADETKVMKKALDWLGISPEVWNDKSPLTSALITQILISN